MSVCGNAGTGHESRCNDTSKIKAVRGNSPGVYRNNGTPHNVRCEWIRGEWICGHALGVICGNDTSRVTELDYGNVRTGNRAFSFATDVNFHMWIPAIDVNSRQYRCEFSAMYRARSFGLTIHNQTSMWFCSKVQYRAWRLVRYESVLRL